MKRMMEPMRFVNGWRFMNIGVLLHIWIISEWQIHTFVFILLLLVMVCLRWRYAIPVWTVGIDMIVCLLYIPFTDFAAFGIALPIFELALGGRWAVSLLLFAGMLWVPAPVTLLLWHYIQACFFGSFSAFMLKNQESYTQELDHQRKARYALERMKVELLEANQAAAHQAELMERYRIARELHDHLGHDLTGAALALQAYQVVPDPEEAKQLLEEVKKRIERSTHRLRETVHNMTPTALIGIEGLEHIVLNFQQLAVRFEKSGDMQRVAAHQWALLAACLKEALTNVARHSNASKVIVDLQVTSTIARLSVQDNGTVTSHSPPGSGLQSLQMRARALNGSLSVQQANGFSIVCVLPLEMEGESYEAHDRG